MAHKYVNKAGTSYMIKDGDIYKSNNCGEFVVLQYNNKRQVLIEFILTKTQKWVSSESIITGSIKDSFYPIVCGVGFMGEGKHTAGNMRVGINPIYGIWRAMIARCYDSTHRSYISYSDCTVCEEWHNFQNYADWFEANKPTDYSGTKYHVDKDKKCPGNRIYSPEFCSFILASENNQLAKLTPIRGKFITRISDPQGNIYEFSHMATFCAEHNLNRNTMNKARKLQSKNFLGGWSIISVEDNVEL